jgi:hypothetical protein
MLKVFLGCMVSVVVLLSSVYVPLGNQRAYAASASVLITHIQAGGVGAATQEFISIYNNTSDDVDITGWCLTNKNNVTIACFVTPLPGQAMYLPAYTYAVVASSSFAIGLAVGTVTNTYVPTNQSSGSITGSSDTISLLTHAGNLVDQQTWTTALAGGMQLQRKGAGVPFSYLDTDTAADWSVAVQGILPVDQTELDITVVDVCSNIEGIQVAVPSEKELSSSGECVDKMVVRLYITELLPNAVGSDDSQEFIELFNPNADPVSLADYELYVGPHDENSYDFPVGSVIPAHDYLIFSNSQIPFTLLNSSSLVLLSLKGGTVVSEVPAYTDPKEGESWAVIADVWQYTNLPTPSALNLVRSEAVIVSQTELLPQPCAENQYRSLETNRCRLISSSPSAITPCKDGQYRSEETNRCRTIVADAKIVTACNEDEERNPTTNRCRKIVVASVAAACKEGQERNLETNRCRTVTKMPSADYAVLGAATENEGNWYVWAVIGGVVLLALGYAIWEWHDEMGKFFRQQYVRVIRFARPHK